MAFGAGLAGAGFDGAGFDGSDLASGAGGFVIGGVAFAGADLLTVVLLAAGFFAAGRGAAFFTGALAGVLLAPRALASGVFFGAASGVLSAGRGADAPLWPESAGSVEESLTLRGYQRHRRRSYALAGSTRDFSAPTATMWPE